jgi:hypothetical protein
MLNMRVSSRIAMLPVWGSVFPARGSMEIVMKKWFMMALVLMMVAGVQAKGDGNKGGKSKSEKPVAAAPITKAEYIEAEKNKAEVSGRTFDEAAAEAAFTEKDKNGDGVLTADEQPSAGGKKGKGKKSK